MKVLLTGVEATYLADTDQKKFICPYGEILLGRVRIGKKIKSSKGHVFLATEPTVIDLLRKCRRMPQVVTPKDAAQIAAQCGVSHGWRCMDAGAGSGFLSIFLGNLVKPDGSVVAYEKNKIFADNVKRNVAYCGLSDVVTVKNRDVRGFSEKRLDLVTLDMQQADAIIKKCHKALKPGGWLAVYSPHIEQQIAARKETETLFTHVKTLETIQREWTSVHGYTHPRPSQVVHTGFMTFARKLLAASAIQE